MSLFPSFFVPLPLSLCMERTSDVFPFRVVFFYQYLVTTGWIFGISLLCENSINQSIHQSIGPGLAGSRIKTLHAQQVYDYLCIFVLYHEY